MMQKKRCLIITSDAGFGHRSAALSVSKALEVLYPGQVEILVTNPIQETDTLTLMKPIEKGYDRSVRMSPGLYRLSYEVSNSRQVSEVVEGALTLMLQKIMADTIRDFKPDIVLNTNEMFNTPIGKALQETGPKIPAYTVVTDLADVHSLWFSSEPDRFYIANEWVKVKALESGVPDEKLVVSGIPVSPDFALNQVEKQALRGSLGLDPHRLTLLFVGSSRVSNLQDYLQALENFTTPVQAVVIAGGNDELYKDLIGSHYDFPVEVRNFEKNVPQWMMASDVLVTKAGGLIISEGLAAGLPILLIDYLPGQEQGNVRYLLSHQAGALVQNVGEFRAMLTHWLTEDGSRLNQVARASAALGHPEAALTIAKALWDAVVTQPEPKLLPPKAGGPFQFLTKN
ncbi:MAG TPA: glycosyltransferase [Anaerolineaceae bacterium]|nr:glycosyltransferase [Anaerolineaceae bacterium]